jgi:hypothetical protein
MFQLNALKVLLTFNLVKGTVHLAHLEEFVLKKECFYLKYVLKVYHATKKELLILRIYAKSGIFAWVE